jgi:uncharacterized membrane protein YccC
VIDDDRSTRSILLFWAPLAAQWSMMALEGPFLAAVIARLVDPTFNLAAYGVAYAFGILVEAPVIMLLSASTALVEDAASYRRLRNFAYALNVFATGLLLLVLLPPVYGALMEDLLALPPAIRELVRGALWIMLPWPAAIGYRRFLHGILIRSGRTRLVAYGTMLRLAVMVVTAVGLAMAGLPGAWVGAAALSSGVVVEAVAARAMAAGVVRDLLSAPDPIDSTAPAGGSGAPAGPRRGRAYLEIASFYYPLALTSLVGLTVQPMLTFFMGRAPSPVESLAVFPVVNSLSFFFRALGLSFQEAAIALLGSRLQFARELGRFATGLALAASGGLGLIAFTPLAMLWFESVSGLPPHLAEMALAPTRVIVLLPALSVVLCFQRAILVKERRTRPITVASFIEVAGIALLFPVFGWGMGFTGVTAAMTAFLGGRLAGVVFLAGRTITGRPRPPEAGPRAHSRRVRPCRPDDEREVAPKPISTDLAQPAPPFRRSIPAHRPNRRGGETNSDMPSPPLRRLLIADPGLQRTLLAGRATLGVALTMAVLYPASRAAGEPPVALMLGSAVAMIGALALSTPGLRSQLRGGAIAWGSATVAVLLGSLLSAHPLPSYAGFVAIMATGAWAGRFGPRGFALVTVGFLAYFFTLFTRSTPGDAPWLLVASTTGVGMALLTRTVILADRPRARLRNLLIALRAQAGTLIAHASGSRPSRGRDLARTLRRDAAEIDGTVLQLHDLLRDAPEAVADHRRFRRHLAAVVTLAHLLVLREQRGQSADDPALAPPSTDPAERLKLRLDAVEAAVAGRSDAEVFGDITPFDQEEKPTLRDPEPGAGDEALPAAAAEHRPPARAGWLTGSTRTAFQVTVAGVLSIGFGYQISPQRWYWAAMSAYFVFVNTGSRGATVRKALERMIGTAAGVAGGMLFGYLLAGHTRFELVAIFPLLFLGFWLLSVSYAAMIMMMTILFALLYDMMGMLTTDVLVLRLEETVLGAAVGTFVALFVLPTSTRSAVDLAFGKYFAAMDELLTALAAGARAGDRAEQRILDAVHDLDRAVAELRAAVRPVVASVPGRWSRELKQEMILALTARYWIHRLAGSMLFHQATIPADELRRQARLVRRRIGRLRQGGGAEPPIRRADLGTTEIDASPLLRVDGILAELGRVRAMKT